CRRALAKFVLDQQQERPARFTAHPGLAGLATNRPGCAREDLRREFAEGGNEIAAPAGPDAAGPGKMLLSPGAFAEACQECVALAGGERREGGVSPLEIAHRSGESRGLRDAIDHWSLVREGDLPLALRREVQLGQGLLGFFEAGFDPVA